MNEKSETSPTQVRRAPEWVSPWSFQAEWQSEPLPEESAVPQEAIEKPREKAAAAAPARVFAKSNPAPEITGRPQERRVESLAPRQESRTDLAASKRPMSASVPDELRFDTLAETQEPPTQRRVAPRPAARERAVAPPSRALRALGALLRLLTLLLGVAGLLMLAQIYLEDVPKPVDEDLRLKLPPDIMPKIGAPSLLRTFLDAILAVEKPELKSTPPWRWDPATVHQVVAANGAAWDTLRDLLADYDWHSNHSAWHREDLGSHASWREVGILLQARVALQKGVDDAAAAKAVVDIGRLARQLQALRSWPSFMQRGQELHVICLQSAARLLRDSNLDRVGLRTFQESLSTIEPLDRDMQEAFSAFYLHEKKRLLGERSGEPLDTMPAGVLKPRAGRLFFKTQETLGAFATAFRGARDAIASPMAAGMNEAAWPARFFLSGLRPNGAGEGYFLDRWAIYRPMLDLHRLAKARQMLVQVMAAIRRYALDYRQPPSGLPNLRPDYLAQEPLDPFSGRPLEYDPLRDLLYSVGLNGLREEGHITEPPLADANEPTVKLGFLPASP